MAMIVDLDLDMDLDMDMNMDMDMIRTETNRNSICLGSVSTFLAKLYKKCFGTVSKRTETKNLRFEINRSWRLIQFYVMDMDMDMDMGTGMGMDMGHFSFVSVCFEWSLGVSVISK